MTPNDTPEAAPTADRAFLRRLDGYRLATAEILYRLPDHPSMLQTYIWQDLDLAPRFPVLNTFLDFWQRELEGAIHSVNLASCGLLSPGEWRTVSADLRLH